MTIFSPQTDGATDIDPTFRDVWVWLKTFDGLGLTGFSSKSVASEFVSMPWSGFISTSELEVDAWDDDDVWLCLSVISNQRKYFCTFVIFVSKFWFVLFFLFVFFTVALSSWKVLKRKKIKLLSQNSYRGSRWDYPKEPNNTGLVHKLVECFNCTTEIFSNRFSRKGQFYTWVNSTLVSNNHFTIIPTANVLLKGRNRKHTLKWTKTVNEKLWKDTTDDYFTKVIVDALTHTFHVTWSFLDWLIIVVKRWTRLQKNFFRFCSTDKIVVVIPCACGRASIVLARAR